MSADELFWESRNDGLRNFSMRWIVVDGIYSSNSRDYGYQFYHVKVDYWEYEDLLVDKDGYIDDSRYTDNVPWSSPATPIPYEYGDIDERAWLEDGIIVGVNQPRW